MESLTLVVRYADGSVTCGESAVRETGKVISEVSVEPEGTSAPPGVISAIEAADVVVLSPGSLFTSTIPSLLGAGVREALADFSGPVVYAANVMTQLGETTGFSLSEHLRALADHVGPIVTDVLVHVGEQPEELVARYDVEGAAAVEVDCEGVEAMGVRMREAGLLSETVGEPGASLRHDPDRLAREVCEAAPSRVTASSVVDPDGDEA